jgi:hypothetical protein
VRSVGPYMAARIKAVLPYASSTAFTLALCVPASALTVSEMTSSRNVVR